MPDGNALVLLVRIKDVLDQSKAGRAAADELRARFQEAKAQHAAMADATEAARFEREFAIALETDKERTRDVLLSRARVAAEKLRVRRGAQIVVDAGAVLSAAPALDVTDEIIAALDADG